MGSKVLYSACLLREANALYTIVFSSSLVNGFDLVFMIIYAVYLGARSYGARYHNEYALGLGADWLAIGQSRY